MTKTGVRNLAIILALAGVGTVWQRGPDSLVFGASQLITLFFVVFLVVFGYQYFREHRLAWLVMKTWQRGVVIACAVLIAALAIVGFPLLGDTLTPLGVMALIAALVLVIVWVIRESRRFR